MTERSEPRRVRLTWRENHARYVVNVPGFLAADEGIDLRTDAACEADVEAVAKWLFERAGHGVWETVQGSARDFWRYDARSLLSTIFKEGGT